MDDELYEAMSDYVASCHRQGEHDKKDNIDHFMCENKHMNLDYDDVEEAYDMADSDYWKMETKTKFEIEKKLEGKLREAR